MALACENSNRQQVIRLRAAGKGQKAIADAVGISRRTVREYLRLVSETETRKRCGASPAAIEAGEGCGKCVACEAVEERFRRWRRAYNASLTLEA